MELNRKLADDLKGKRYLRSDGRVITISDVNQITGTSGFYFEVVYRVDEPVAGMMGTGCCLLTDLERLVELR